LGNVDDGSLFFGTLNIWCCHLSGEAHANKPTNRTKTENPGQFRPRFLCIKSRASFWGGGGGGSNDISLRRHQIRLSSWANTDTHIYAARKSDTHRDNREWQISLCGSRARQPNSLGNKEKNCPKERQKPKNRGKKLEKRKIQIQHGGGLGKQGEYRKEAAIETYKSETRNPEDEEPGSKTRRFHLLLQLLRPVSPPPRFVLAARKEVSQCPQQNGENTKKSTISDKVETKIQCEHSATLTKLTKMYVLQLRNCRKETKLTGLNN